VGGNDWAHPCIQSCDPAVTAEMDSIAMHMISAVLKKLSSEL
jgi:hypothetical protein